MALKGCRIDLPFFLLQSLRKMAHTIQTIIGDIEQSLFHHGILKILFQYQLNRLGRYWDEFLNANDFGLTQYLPTLHPKTCRKRKGFPQTEVNYESRGVESSELRVPIEDNPRHTVAVESLSFKSLNACSLGF